MHQSDNWKPAPRPGTVLVKVNANERWWKLLVSAGVRINERTFDRALQLKEERVKSAQSLGRDAYAARDGRSEKEAPEDADSGSPVFGRGGLADCNVSIEKLIRQLFDAGYVISDTHLLSRNHKPPGRLVVEFSKRGQKAAVATFPWDIFKKLIATTFDQVDVWANPPKNGIVTHTVNCGKRKDDMAPRHDLYFAHGDWNVAERVEASASIPEPVLA